MLSQIKIKQLFTLDGTIDRGPFLVWGIILFLIKYMSDRIISLLVFDQLWNITDYFIRADQLIIGQLSDESKWFYLTFAITSIPFIYVGTVLCLKRLRSADLSSWLVLLFFIPFLNFLLFFILSILPKKENDIDTEKHAYLSRLIPKNQIGSNAVAIGITIFMAMLTTFFTINYLEEYGWGLFVGIPFFLGFASVLISSYHSKRSYTKSLEISFYSMLLFGFVIIGLAVEGIICVAMAFPIAVVLGLLGATLGYYVQIHKKSTAQVIIVTFLFIPFTSFVEHKSNNTPTDIYVITSVEINAPIDQVWNEVIYFKEIPPPTQVIFNSGISYPIKASIEYGKSDTIRYCIFNSGTFVEPITKWEKPNLLEFEVLDQPEPLEELSPYGKIEAPHLNGYFKTTHGRFQLTQMENNKTVLTGTTWYKNDLWPNFYWRYWSDYLIHAIHKRVLNHIKLNAEKDEV
jgi:uncharacterized membrane protein YhaH (DUF805 family)